MLEKTYTAKDAKGKTVQHSVLDAGGRFEIHRWMEADWAHPKIVATFDYEDHKERREARQVALKEARDRNKQVGMKTRKP